MNHVQKGFEPMLQDATNVKVSFAEAQVLVATQELESQRAGLAKIGDGLLAGGSWKEGVTFESWDQAKDHADKVLFGKTQRGIARSLLSTRTRVKTI